MSLTHGHLYVAEKVREELSGNIRELIDSNIDAYRLGSIGHDIIYWAGTYSWNKNKNNAAAGPYFFLPVDPHQSRTGEMIRNLLEDYLSRRNAIYRELPEREQEVLARERKIKEKYDEIRELETRAVELSAKNAIADEKNCIGQELKAVESDKRSIAKERALLEKLKTEKDSARAAIEKEIGALLEERKRPVERYLSFILGWITHRTTDTYVHALVDVYGGRYNPLAERCPENSRHLQLELVETKYVVEITESVQSQNIPETNGEIWAYFARPLARTYPDAVVQLWGNRRKAPDEFPCNFSGIVDTTVRIMNQAKACAEECCSNSDGIATTFWNQPIENEWMVKSGTRIPSQKTYDAITSWRETGPDNSGIISIKRDASSPLPAYDVYIADTGLYGKFMKDYDHFVDAAVEKAVEMINVAAASIAGINPRPGESPHIPPIGDVDILLPENVPEVAGSAAMKEINDGTARNIFSIPGSQRNRLYYETEYQLRSACNNYYDRVEYVDTKKTKIPGRYVEVIPEKDTGNRLYMSRAGTARLAIDIPNPEKCECILQLKLSLTSETAFGTPRYRDIEYKVQDDLWPGKIHYISYNKDGGKNMEWDEINDLREGRWTSYAEDGVIEEECYYAGGKQEGRFKSYFEDGKTVMKEGDYKNDMQVGLWITYSEDGKKKSEDNYLCGQKSGKSISYFETGQISAEEEYQNGQKNGKSISYFQTGQISAEEEYQNDLRHGHWTYYHENGNKSQEGDDLNGNQTGHWVDYYENGAMRSEGETGGGHIDYYEKGRVSGQMSAGGHWTAWYENGNKKEEGDYADNGFGRQRTGRWTSYYENGLKGYEGAYEKDMPAGHWVYWWENGNRKMEGDMAEGSVWSYWNKEGVPVKKEDFRNW